MRMRLRRTSEGVMAVFSSDTKELKCGLKVSVRSFG